MGTPEAQGAWPLAKTGHQGPVAGRRWSAASTLSPEEPDAPWPLPSKTQTRVHGSWDPGRPGPELNPSESSGS